jgi:hypothetical protein
MAFREAHPWKVRLDERRCSRWRDTVQENLDKVWPVMLGTEFVGVGDDALAQRAGPEDEVIGLAPTSRRRSQAAIA